MKPEKNNYTDIEEELVILPQELSYDNTSGKIILFKHDYYSSDSEYGRDLLNAFLDSFLADPDMISRVFFIDCSVRLLGSEDLTVRQFLDVLVKNGKDIYVSEDSLSTYGAGSNPPDNCHLVSDHMVAEMIICQTPDIVIE